MVDPEPGPVVVIDDEPEILELVGEALQVGGFDSICLHDPESAHALSPTIQPGLFLVDVMLPGETGIELARELRTEGFAETPMVAMSASSMMLKEASASHLFAATIPKPFELRDLLETVARFAA